MQTVVDATHRFLRNTKNGNTEVTQHVLENSGVELQILMKQSPGWQAGAKPKPQGSFTDGVNWVYPTRINPKNLPTKKVIYPIDDHVGLVGSTGWDFANKHSLWVGFDFDSIIGHAPGVGINESELHDVAQALAIVPYVSVYRSKSGRGFHAYVFLPPGTPAATNAEHSQNAQSVLTRLSVDTGLDLQDSVDVCGQVLWFWAYDAKAESGSFAPMSKASIEYPHPIAPPTPAAPRTTLPVASDDEDRFFNDLIDDTVTLDDNHKAVIAALGGFDGAKNMLTTHVCRVQQLCGTLLKRFETISPGQNIDQDNSFMFPVAGGKWRLCRYGMGTPEHTTWKQAPQTYSYIVVEPMIESKPVEPSKLDYDAYLRMLSNPKKQLGWLAKDNRGVWLGTTDTGARQALITSGTEKKQVDGILGMLRNTSWVDVSIPFGEEYPGNRQWNRYGPQLALTPVAGDHRTWDTFYDHVGKSLNHPLKLLGLEGLATGRDYLQQWVNYVIKHPYGPLPYLLFIGQQKVGKSLFFESLEPLFTCGVVDAYLALKSQWNRQLEGAIVAYVDEKDVNTESTCDKVKDWVNAKKLTIRRMGTDPYDVRNSLHWIQCANDIAKCPIPDGDTRTTVIHVDPPTNPIPKTEFVAKLLAEAPAFLHTIMNLELAPITDRLNIPAITTAAKLDDNPIGKWLQQNVVWGKQWCVPRKQMIDTAIADLGKQYKSAKIASYIEAITGVTVTKPNNLTTYAGLKLKGQAPCI